MSTVHVNGDKRREDSGHYDVFVSESGCRFEFGPRRMHVVGKCSDADVLQFVKHVRFRNLVRGTAPFPLVEKRPPVKVLGIRMGEAK